MKISEVGELDLIQRISSMQLPLNQEGLFGIGDDCAVIPISADKSMLVTTDALVEGIHFIKNKISARDLGYKSLAVNLSDIAAMGGTPQSVYLTLSLPKETELEWVEDFLLGFRSLSEKYQVLLLGGDTTGSLEKIFINITALGFAAPKKIKMRSGAQVGDLVCLTDFIGNSAGGISAILEERSLDLNSNYLIQKHYRPEPHIHQGLFLGDQIEVTSMMDLSDGLFSDIQKIVKSSNCGADINLEELPISVELKNYSLSSQKDPFEMAAIGGEDYCLLLTVNESFYKIISKKFEEKFSQKLFSIGKITDKKGKLNFFKNQKSYSLKNKNFSHF